MIPCMVAWLWSAAAPTLEEGSLVVGDVVIVGGDVEIYGEVDGNVIAIGGQAYLGEDCVVNADLVTIGGAVQREEGALVRGAITAEMPEGFELNNFNPEALNANRDWRSILWNGFKPVGDMIMNVMQALAMAALAAVLALFLLKPMERVSQAVVLQPLPAGGLGILTVIVLPALLVVLAITIILIPLSLIGFLVLGAGFRLWVDCPGVGSWQAHGEDVQGGGILGACCAGWGRYVHFEPTGICGWYGSLCWLDTCPSWQPCSAWAGWY